MSEMMKALQYVEFGQPPRVVEVPKPTAGPGQIVLKVTAAGVCHSDEFVMSLPAEVFPQFFNWTLPITLGHEGAGIVHELGEGVTEFAIGDAVAVYGPWGCGVCVYCIEGNEMQCPHAIAQGINPPGLGNPGAMAEYMLIDTARHLVPLGDLDPVANVSLTDAGLTPYHAVKSSISKLGAGSTVVTIGAGGLGHMAIQILRAITGAVVITLDVSEDKRKHALEVGAHHVFDSNDEAVARIRELTNGVGANVVLDFVGIQATAELAGKMVAPAGDVQIVGVGGGALPVGFGAVPYDATVRSPYWGSHRELIEVLELARRGQIKVDFEAFSLNDGAKAYERLHEGSLRGRAVIVP
jgi:propanol-preferring alcohol dehydrogenase